MSNLVPIDQAMSHAPALMRQRMQAGTALAGNFQEGIRDAYPVLSIKGKVFRARISGQETPFIDQSTRQPIGFLDVILVNASRTLAKSYYKSGFSEGDMNPPDCWSLDSVRPDPSVANKVSLACQTCPMNAFGSRVTDNGKQAKACQDARRVAVVMPHVLMDEQPLVMMLRVPQSSLKNLKAYAQLLERHQFEPGGCITRMAFDYNEAFPKLLFNFVAPLNDVQYARVVQLAEGPIVTGMLEAPDFDNAPSTAPVQDQGTQHTGIGGLVPQQAPVLMAGGAGDVAHNPATMATQGSALPPGVIELPDGKLFNPSTNSYVERPKPVEQPKPDLKVVPSNLIELPDGKLFDPATGQYVERSQPAVQMAQPDPNTMTLPDGKYFNTVLKQFVTGPEIGAKAVDVNAEQPAKRERKPRKKADAAAQQTQGQEAQQPAAETAQPEAAEGDDEPELPMGQNDAPQQANGDASGNGTPVVSAASMDLQAMLQKLVPANTQ